MTNQAAVEYLESEEYFAEAYRARLGDGTSIRVIRPMFQLFTDHKFNAVGLEAEYGSDSEDLQFEIYREDNGSNLCGKCGHDPIILGPDGVDSE